MINRYSKLVLEYRVRKLEKLLFEGKKDQEILNNFLGDEYYNKYQLIKNKIKDPEYKDVYRLIKKDLSNVKDYIDNIQSNVDKRKSYKSDGAKLIYKNKLWKVYRITTYKAAQLYGAGTTWCITGNYQGHEDRGEKYFNDYITDCDLDGGYYFYIKNDGKTKFCLLRQKDGDVHSIWDAEDTDFNPYEITSIDSDFPSIPGVFTFDIENPADAIYSNSAQLVHAAAHKKGVDINAKCNDRSKEYFGYTPLEWHVKNILETHSSEIPIALLSFGAKITPRINWKNLVGYFDTTVFKVFISYGLLDVFNPYEILEYIIHYSNIIKLDALLGAKIDVTKPLSDGKSALYHELTNKDGARLSVVKLLVSEGANINEVLDNGDSLIDLARSNPKNKAPIIEYLLNNM